MKPVILIVDDDDDDREALADFLSTKGYAVLGADRLKRARKVLSDEDVDGVLLDLKLPDGNGLDWIGPLREENPRIAIIVITGAAGDIPTVTDAMRRGADDFVTKPVDTRRLSVVLEKTLETEDLRRREMGRRRLSKRQDIFFGESPAAKRVWKLAATAAANNAVLLLQGETGTGKGVVAKWIHENGKPKSAPYVEVNCSSLRGELLASELFGHRKGAFTSAIENREGLIEVANGGTLFLDEIADMDLAVQAQFLKVIEEKRFRRVGEVKVRRSDFRLICATNRDLAKEVEEGRFRRDLYYRICVFPIDIPPLRERRADLPDFAAHLFARLGRPDVKVSKQGMTLLRNYAWPGNVRELSNVLERALLLCGAKTLKPEHFPGIDQRGGRTPKRKSAEGWNLDRQQAEHIQNALDHFDGDISQAARALGVSRATLYRRLKKLKKVDA